MNLQEIIDPTLGEMGTLDPLPAGEYLCVITDSEPTKTKDGNSQYLKIELEVVDGDYKGRKVFSNLNLWHSKPQVVEIAKKELNSIIAATGVQNPKDSSQLQGIPIVVKLTQKKSEYMGEERIQNNIVGYRSKLAAASQKQPATQTTGASQWLNK
jgi:hypothetical protein